jgi:hypothetical protein
MSVAGILSSLSHFQLGGPTTAAKQGIQLGRPIADATQGVQLGRPITDTTQGIQQLGQALQSGNLTAAQSDFAALQQAFAQAASATATTSATPAGSPIKQAFNQLASDLQSGNLSASQKDFSSLQQDIQSASGSGSAGNLRHHHHFSGGSSSASTPNSLAQDSTQLGQDLASGNLSTAQQTYAALQALPPDAFGGGQLQSESPVSVLA